MSGPKIARRKINGAGWEVSPGPEITAYHTNPVGRVVGTVAICTRDRIAAATAISWKALRYGFLGPAESISEQIVQGHVLTLQRNECVQRMTGDFLVFIDDDMVFAPDAVTQLVETQRKFDLDIVGGLCFQRGAPHQPTLYVREPESGNYQFREDWPEDTALEVDATGMAFVLIHARVFDAILRHNGGEGMPSYEERAHMPPPPFFKWGGEFGEDFLFCQEAKAAGCRVFVDTSVKVGHVGEQIITADTFLRELAFRPPEVAEVRRSRNDRLNLPTVTPDEAMSRLRQRLSTSEAPRTPSSSPSPLPAATQSTSTPTSHAGQPPTPTTSASARSGRSIRKSKAHAPR
jgi:hypothetical protein